MASGMYGLMERPEPRLEDFVLVPNVRAISNGLTLICALDDDRRFGVPSDCIGEQSEVRRPGDYGTLAVLIWFAETHQLPTAA
jgi:hypothetical protein